MHYSKDHSPKEKKKAEIETEYQVIEESCKKNFLLNCWCGASTAVQPTQLAKVVFGTLLRNSDFRLGLDKESEDETLPKLLGRYVPQSLHCPF